MYHVPSTKYEVWTFFAPWRLCAPTASAVADSFFLLAKAHLGGQDAEPQRNSVRSVSLSGGLGVLASLRAYLIRRGGQADKRKGGHVSFFRMIIKTFISFVSFILIILEFF